MLVGGDGGMGLDAGVELDADAPVKSFWVRLVGYLCSLGREHAPTLTFLLLLQRVGVCACVLSEITAVHCFSLFFGWTRKNLEDREAGDLLHGTFLCLLFFLYLYLWWCHFEREFLRQNLQFLPSLSHLLHHPVILFHSAINITPSALPFFH